MVTLAQGLPIGLAEPFRTALQSVALLTQPFFLPSLLSPSQGTHLLCHPNSPDLLQLFPFLNKPLAHLISFWHLLLRSPKLTELVLRVAY